MRRWYTKPYLGVPLNREHDLAQGLVGCWLFNEGGGGKVYDLSGNNNHGTLTNMNPLTDWVPGKFGYALDFDGSNDYVDTSSLVIDPSTTDFSLALWLKMDVAPSGGKNDGVIAQQDGTGTGRTWLQIREIINKISTKLGGGTETGNFVVTTGVWNYIVLTKSGTTVQFYANGAFDSTHTVIVEAADGAMRFGSHKGGVSFFNGLIDDVRIYNRALTAPEIQQLYLEPFCMFEYPSVAEYFLPAAPPPPASTFIPTNPAILTGLNQR